MNTPNSMEKPQKLKKAFLNELMNFKNLLSTIKSKQGKSAPNGLANWLVSVERQIDVIDKDTFRVMVIGEFNRGKSTLVNAFLRERIVDVDSTPCTAILSYLKYGKEPSVKLIYNKGNSKIISLEEYKEEYSLKNERDKRKTEFNKIKYAEIKHPADFLKKSGIELIDSPGLNEELSREELTIKNIDEAQAIIFILNYAQPVTNNEKKYIKQRLGRFYENMKKDNPPPIFFIANQWDKIEKDIREEFEDEEESLIQQELKKEEDKLKGAFIRRLQTVLPLDITETEKLWNKHIFPISARRAERFYLKNQTNQKILTKSGLPALENELSHFFIKGRLNAQFMPTWSDFNRILREYNTYTKNRNQALKLSLADLKQKLIRLNSLTHRAGSHLNKMLNHTKETKNQTVRDIGKDFETFMNYTLVGNYDVNFKPQLDKIPFKLTQTKKYKEDVKNELENWIEEELNDWAVSAESRIILFIDILRAKVMREFDQYKILRNEIDELFRDKDEIEKFSPSTTLSFENIDLDPKAVFSAAFVGFLFGKTIVIGILGKLLLVLGLYSLFGLVALPIAVILGAKVAKGMLNSEINKAVKKALKEKVRQISSEYKPVIENKIKELFDEYMSNIEDVENDVNALNADYNQLLVDKSRSEDEAKEEVIRLKNYSDNFNAISKSLNSIIQTVKN